MPLEGRKISAYDHAARMGHPRKGMKKVGRRDDKGCGAAMATFEGSTFVGIRALWIGAILLTAMGGGEIILV